jgi:2-dehydro-3-deoxyphosphogalactonate aldolase
MQPSEALDTVPLVAILRGVTPQRIGDIGRVLFEAGLRVIEVPLNSPDPFRSIEALSALFGETCLCGGGTVLRSADVDRIRDAGGRLVVSPNTNPSVIARTIKQGMVSMPGFATATEAFAAIDAGARELKLFPAASYGCDHLRALKAVLPGDARVYAVGGVKPDKIEDWLDAGAAGFGFGSEIFQPEFTTDEISRRARQLMEAFRRARD